MVKTVSNFPYQFFIQKLPCYSTNFEWKISAFTTTSVCLFSNGRALHIQVTSSDTKTNVVLQMNWITKQENQS